MTFFKKDPPKNLVVRSFIFRRNGKTGAILRATGTYSDACAGFSHPIDGTPIDIFMLMFSIALPWRGR